jgi:hypothetical protein
MTSGFSMYLRCGDSIDVSYPQVGMDIICLLDSAKLGEGKPLIGCRTLPIGRQVLDSANELIPTHGGSCGGHTVCWRLLGVTLVPGQES